MSYIKGGIFGWVLMLVPTLALLSSCWYACSSCSNCSPNFGMWLLGIVVWLIGSLLILRSFFGKKKEEICELEEK